MTKSYYKVFSPPLLLLLYENSIFYMEKYQKVFSICFQICNWFANWRRKLKNAGKEPQKNTWGHLIKNYNTNAHGNVEQFSICSNDSIWEDEQRQAEYFEQKHANENADNYHQSSNVYFDGYHKIVDTGYDHMPYESNGDCDEYTKDETSAQSYDNKSRKSSLESCISREQCYKVSAIFRICLEKLLKHCSFLR